MEEIEKRQHYRPTAREHANAFSEKMASASAEGINIHQLGIDLNDQEMAFIASLPEEDRDLYETLYVEELNACTSATSAKTMEIERRTLETQIQNAQSSFAWVWAVVAGLFIVMFFAR